MADVVSVLTSLMHWALMKGGGETYATRLASNLQAKGVSITMISGKPILFGKVEPPESSIRVHYVPHANLRHPATRLTSSKNRLIRSIGRGISATSSLTYACSLYVHLIGDLEKDFEVIHLHDSFVTLRPALKVKKKYGKPVVITLHGPSTDPLLRKADCVVAFGHAYDIVRATGVKPRMIPPAIDMSSFNQKRLQDYRQRLRAVYASPSEAILLFVGRLIPVKNLECLLRVVRQLVTRGQKTRLLIVGDGPLLYPLRRLTCSLGIGQYVRFVGAVPHQEVAKFYAIADAFILPSLYDNYPIAVLEAMAAGLPVVAAKVGGTPKLIEDGVNGFLIPLDGSPSRFAIAIERLINEPEMAKRLGGEAGRAASKHPSWDSVAEQYRAVYEEVLKR